MSKRLSLLLYNLLLPLGLLFMLPGAMRKMRARGGRWQDMAERLGLFSQARKTALAALPCGQQRLWIHAVSVGEVGIATKLLTLLFQHHPQTGIVLTTTTPTGHALAEAFAAKQADRVQVLYSPVDLPLVGSCFLNVIQPSQIVLIEAELWPNLISAAKNQGIRVSMVNARLSARSERRFQRFSSFIKPMYEMLDQVLVQEPGDIARFSALGVPTTHLHHAGSIKFDPQGASVAESELEPLRQILKQVGIGESQPILLLASTHRGEERLLTRTAQNLQKQFPDLVLLIVPRHIERTEEILAELKSLGLHAQRRSQIVAEQSRIPNRDLQTMVIDSTGELRAWQCLASLVIVGKSFLAHGGQNPAEAVMAEKPVLFGPHMENFESLVELLLRQGGAIQVPDEGALETELRRLLADTALRQRYGRAGKTALAAHEGATQRSLERLFLPKL